MLIVEDGTGLATAEAYVSVADATSKLAALGITAPTAWATESEAETDLRFGALWLDGEYHSRWLGRRKNDTQALDWPRSSGFTEPDGYLVPDTSVPDGVALANALAGAENRALATTGGLMAASLVAGTLKERTVKLGPLTKSLVYAGGASTTTRYQFPRIAAALSGLVYAPGSLRLA